MVYRVCKRFEVESGHMLFKHPGRCKYPHGHSRLIEIVVASPELDENDMVCDFKALKLAVADVVDRLDHALAVNSDDPVLNRLGEDLCERVVVFQKKDPTTEVLARYIYEEVVARVASGRSWRAPDGSEYRLPAVLMVERVRVGETSSTWAEYAAG